MHKAGCDTLEEYERYVREQLGYASIDDFEADMKGAPRDGSADDRNEGNAFS